MRQLRPEELAWIAVAPCAVVVTLAIVLLGPPLGEALLTPDATLWPPEARYLAGSPEPVKHARYLLALLAPVLLSGVILAPRTRGLRLTPRTARGLVRLGQALTAGFLVVAVLGQHNRIVAAHPPLWPIFSWRTLATALVLALLALGLPRSRRIAAAGARLVRETRARAAASFAIAGLCTTAWLLTAVTSDRLSESGAMAWTMDDPYAVLDGRTPLVDFHPVYAHLQPYPTALALSLLGTTIFVYTLLMTAFSGLALLAIYAVLRRVARNSLLGLTLFLPVLAIGFLLVAPDPTSPSASNVTLFGVWPIRYGGAYLLAWLTARHLDGAVPRRRWLLCTLAVLVAIDEVEFGGGALLGTLAALACASPRGLRRLARDAAVGAAIAIALVVLLTLARAGRPPDFGSLLEFPHLFGIIGLVSAPMPTLGFHLVLYATFIAAIAAAAVRIRRRDEALLTGMLAWSGTFGLIAGGYFLGRSEVGKLIALFSAWGLAVALLAIVVVRDLHARGWRRPGVPALAVLGGLALSATALAQAPNPAPQLRRLSRAAPAYRLPVPRFIQTHTRRGETAAILTPLGHRIAFEVGVSNVAPYAFLEVISTRAEMERVFDILRHRHVYKVFMPDYLTVEGHRLALAAQGYRPRASGEGISLFTNAAAPSHR